MTETHSAGSDQDTFPGVSIIVPAYNDQAHIGALIESLLAQDYPKDKLEIIVVDNHSTDQTPQIIRQYPVRYLEETRLQSSYAARNRGIQVVAHEVLAFIDSDCRADSSWLAEGVRTLQTEHADLVGGKVEFSFFSQNPSAAEYYDSLMHFHFEKTIAEKKGTGAGNLFTYKRIFDRIGMFPEVASGGDFQWSHKAMQEGLRVVFAPKAIVKHPARRLRQILKKQYRTGTGYPYQRLARGQSRFHDFFYLPARLVCTGLPIARMHRDIDEDGREILKEHFWGIVWVAWICIIVYRWGAWMEFLKTLCRPRKTDE